LHADKIDPARLEGRAADTFEPFLRRRLEEGVREFGVIPLFFGPSRALTEFVPERVATLMKDHGDFSVRLGDVLCPLPAGEPLLVDILLDQLNTTAARWGVALDRVVLVDHGSPLPAVTAVRQHLARRLHTRLGEAVELSEAVMERRKGSDYDFNGPLLEDRLEALAAEAPSATVLLSMLFLSPGRHAGPGGDIEDICRSVAARHPGFRVFPTALVAEHPTLVDILDRRVAGLAEAGRETGLPA
jgi:sirohydrochlorin ferrochelatase